MGFSAPTAREESRAPHHNAGRKRPRRVSLVASPLRGLYVDAGAAVRPDRLEDDARTRGGVLHRGQISGCGRGCRVPFPALHCGPRLRYTDPEASSPKPSRSEDPLSIRAAVMTMSAQCIVPSTRARAAERSVQAGILPVSQT